MSVQPPDQFNLLERLKRLPRWVFWTVPFVLILSLIAFSIRITPQPQANTQVPPGIDTLDSWAYGLRVILMLGVVVILIYLSLYLVRRWQTGLRGGSAKQLTIIETTHLSPRQALHLVRIGSKTVLIGATDQTLTMLGEVDGGPDGAGQLDEPLDNPGVEKDKTSPFADMLIKKLLKR